MPRRKIDIGNAEDVIVRGKHVSIVPPEGEFSSVRRVSRMIRGQGIDIINGPERLNPTSIPLTDASYPGWRVVGTYSGEEVAVTNNLLAGWEQAWLIISVTLAVFGYNSFEVVVNEARLENENEYPNTYPVWKNNPGDGSMTVASGKISLPVAVTSNGQRRQVNFHQFPLWWDEYNTPALAAERYAESVSTTGLNDCGLGYTINVTATSGAVSVASSNFCYMDSVSVPYSFDGLVIPVKQTF